jgi:hypothetical protein
MRHAIAVVGNELQRKEGVPVLALPDEEAVRMSTWYACTNQDDPAQLLEERVAIVRWFLVLILAYQFYILVHNTKVWSGRRPLILIRGRGLASKLAAYAGTWGGGDVVKADLNNVPPLGPTRFVLNSEGKLQLFSEAIT